MRDVWRFIRDWTLILIILAGCAIGGGSDLRGAEMKYIIDAIIWRLPIADGDLDTMVFDSLAEFETKEGAVEFVQRMKALAKDAAETVADPIAESPALRSWWAAVSAKKPFYVLAQVWKETDPELIDDPELDIPDQLEVTEPEEVFSAETAAQCSEWIDKIKTGKE